MAKALPIPVMLLLMTVKSTLRSARNLLARVGVFRLGMIFVKAALFSLQLSGTASKPARALVNLTDHGDRTLDLACLSVATAEIRAAAAQTEELWYELKTTRGSQAVESIQDLLSVVLLSTRARSFSLTLHGNAPPAFDGLALTGLAGGEGSDMASPVALLARSGNSRALAEVLSKPFYLSEIGPNDYLKRAANGRRVVLVSMAGGSPASGFRQLLGDTRKFFGEDGSELFVLLDRCPVPEGQDIPDGVVFQPLGVLGFTSLERLALARYADVLVTDFAPYILSALAGDATIISPVLPAAGQKVTTFEISTASSRHAAWPGVQSGERR